MNVCSGWEQDFAIGRIRLSVSGEMKWIQNGRFEMGSSSCWFSSKDLQRTLLSSSLF